MKAVKAELATSHPDQVDSFEKGAQTYAKKIVANFKDFEFVSGFLQHISNVLMKMPVHWRKHESGWYGCSSELPGMDYISGLSNRI